MTILTTHDQVPQISRPAGTVLRPAPAPTGMTGKDMFRAIQKHKWLIIICVLVSTILAIVGTYVWETCAPWYTAEALLAVAAPKVSMLTPSSEQTPREIMDRLANLEARMIRTEPVILAALKDESLTGTAWYRDNREKAIQKLPDAISVSPVSSEGLVRIAMTGTKPAELARIVNAVATAAVSDAQESSKGVYLEQINRLETERQSLETQMQELNNRKMAARPKDIPMIESQRNSLSSKLDQLNNDINHLQAAKSAADSQVEQLKKVDMTHWPDVMAYVENDPTMRMLKTARVNLETERDNMLRKYGPGHRGVQDLQTRLKSVNQQIDECERELTPKGIQAEEARRLGFQAEMVSQLLEATSRLEELNASQKGLESTLDKLRDFQEKQNRLNEQITNIQKRETELNLLRPEPQIYLRRAATAPREASWPKWEVMVPLGIVLGLIAGFGLTFLLEFVDTSVKSAIDITRRMDLPVLGMIPHTDDLEEEIADLRLAFASNPSSLVGEAFRQVRTCLLFSGPAAQRRSLLVTSALPEDGRTTVTFNLAASIARGGRKVLVVDANFRQPAVRKLFPQCKDAGLSNVLVGQAAWRDLVCEVEPNLWVLSSGPLPPNPAELLGSEAMRGLIAETVGQYDQVIFDGAPALVISDSQILSTMVDGVILVVRAGSNTYGIVQRTRDMLLRVQAHMLGVVINGVRATAGGYFRKSYEAFYDYHQQTPKL